MSETTAGRDIPPARARDTRPLKLAGAAAAFLAVLLLPPQHGLSAEGQRALAVVVAAVVMWATEAVPVAVACLAVPVLMIVTSAVRTPPEALAGFSSPILFFLIGSQVMGAAVMRSGLAGRLAVYLVQRSRGDPRKLLVHLLVAMPAMAFAIPSAINRNTMLIPAYEEVFRSLGVSRGDRLPRVVMLVLGILNPLASSAFMTGGLASMTTSTLLGGFTWLGWFALMSVPYYLLIAAGGLMIYLMYRPPAIPASDGVQPPVSDRSPWSRSERATMLVILGTSALWLADFIHHWNAAIPALIAAVVLLSPRVGVLSWGEFEKMTGWGNFFFLGTSLSLTQVLISTGAASWFAGVLMATVGGAAGSYAVLVLIVILVASLVHLAIPNQASCIALLIPIVTAFAAATGMNPVAAGLIVGIAVDTVIVYQVQTVTVLLAYETGHFATRDVLRVGLGMLAITMAVVLLVAIPWWGLLGLPAGT